MKTDVVQVYMKQPICVRAIQFTGANVDIIREFTGGKMSAFHRKNNLFYINTLEGLVLVKIGDYIVRGVVGEYYPVRQDVFELTYKEVKSAEDISSSPSDMGSSAQSTG